MKHTITIFIYSKDSLMLRDYVFCYSMYLKFQTYYAGIFTFNLRNANFFMISVCTLTLL